MYVETKVQLRDKTFNLCAVTCGTFGALLYLQPQLFFNACSLLRLLECRFFIFNPACIARGVYKVAVLLVVFEVSARLLYKP